MGKQGSSVEEIWNNFRNVVYEGIERFVPHKILRKFRIPNITTRRYHKDTYKNTTRIT
jgi:hypothetical protein